MLDRLFHAANPAMKPRSLPIGPMSGRWLGDNRVSQTLKNQWLKEGFVVLPSVFKDDEIVPYNDAVASIRASVDDGKDAYGFGDRIGQLHQKLPDLLSLAVNQQVREFLRWAFDDEVLLFASLNFQKGTQQDAHIDAIFFWPEPCFAMAGVWIALEDIHEDAGPLFYVPGSHTWPFYQSHHVASSRPELDQRRQAARNGDLNAQDRAAVIRDLGLAWTEDFKMLELVQASQRRPMPIRKGDVVVWHSLLAHGGSPRLNPALSRKSVVFHFIGANAKLYTDEQFFLYGRHEFANLPHQQQPIGYYRDLRYMQYPHFVTYGVGGRQIIHPLGPQSS